MPAAARSFLSTTLRPAASSTTSVRFRCGREQAAWIGPQRPAGAALRAASAGSRARTRNACSAATAAGCRRSMNTGAPPRTPSSEGPRDGRRRTWIRLTFRRETQMDWNIIEGKWKELKGHAREEWGKLSDDELEEVGGKKDRLVGKLQQKYGYAADEADRRADEWAKQQDARPQDEASNA